MKQPTTQENNPERPPALAGARGSGDPAKLMSSDSIADKLKLLKEMGAAMTQIVYRKADDTPLAAVIFVHGDETAEILEAVKAVEDSWN
jgi:hypothetical protein